MSDDENEAQPEWKKDVERYFDGNVAHDKDEQAQLFDKIPPAQLREVIRKSRDMGAEAFKQKDWKNAHQFYNQAVFAAERLKDPDLIKVLGNRSACHLALGNHDLALRDASTLRTCLASLR